MPDNPLRYDIVEQLRDFAASLLPPPDWSHHAALVAEAATLVAEAAMLIEQQRAMIANWEAAWAVQRGNLSRDLSAADEPAVITPAEPNTPR